MKIQFEYRIKDTMATTEYREIHISDKKFIMNWLTEVFQICEDCETCDDAKFNAIGKQLARPTAKLPWKGKQAGGGMNSIKSAVEGILDNLTIGTQRDLSAITCKLLTMVTQELIKIDMFSNWEEFEFVEVSGRPKAVTFTAPFVEKKVEPVIETTFDNLFEIDTVTVTYRKK
jgi:hypothetical protein